MHAFARVLLQERWRKLNANYGRAGYICAGVLFAAFSLAGAASAAGIVVAATAAQWARLFIWLWAGWIIFAIISGKDLSWQIRLERILIFPSPGFARLFIMAFILGFLSLPLMSGLLVAQFWTCLRAGFGWVSAAEVLAGYLLFVASIRFAASLGRAAIYRRAAMGRPGRSLALAGTAFGLAGTVVSLSGSAMEALHPGYQFSRLLLGKGSVSALVWLAWVVVLLALADYVVEREWTYSGGAGLKAPGGAGRAGIFLAGPARPGPLLRIGLLAWLRSRNALLMFAFGSVYSFCWTVFYRPTEASYYFLFVLMNLAFHAYLRGNLLGTDRSGVWIYYSIPGNIDRAASSRSLALTLLQGFMVAALIAPGLFLQGSHMGFAAWGRILSYALSSLLFGEVWGLYFSIRYPEPIDRNSLSDGGTAVGALAGGALQVLFMIAFILASRFADRILAPPSYWAVLLAVPALLFLLRFALLPAWVRKTMLEDREIIFRRLAAY